MYDLTVAGSTSGFGDNAYTDNGSPIQFTPDGDAATGFTLQNGSNYITCPATAGAASLSTTSSAWKFLTQSQYDDVLAAKVTAQEAAIATAKGITIPTGQTLNDVVTDVDNWAASATIDDGLPTSSNWTATNHPDRKNQYINWGTYGTEMYQVCNGHYTRTITGLKKGIYKVSVRAMKRVGTNANCYTMGQAGYPVSDSYLSANGNIIRIKAWYEDCVDNGNPNSTSQFVNVSNNGGYTTEGFAYVSEDGNLALDVASEAYWGSCWLLFNGISYTFYNNEVSDDDATTILSQAATLVEKPMQTTVKNALTSAKNTFDGARTIENYNALSTAMTNANTSVTAYANAKAYFDEAATVLANTNVYTATAYATYYTEPKAKYDAGTLTIEEANALNIMGGWHVANTIDDILLSAWTIGGEQCTNYDKSLYINTWSTEGNSDGSNFKTPFFEYWVGSGNLAANTIQGEVTGLIPDGLYKVDVWARLQKSGSDFADNGITLQVGEGTALDLTKAAQIGSTNRYANVFTASGTADADGKLTVKIVVAENSGCSWLSFKDVKYAELEDERIPLANQLATAVAEAKSLSTTLVIPEPAKTVLFNVADKYQDFTYTSLETAAKFTAAITEVNSAIATAQSMVVPYAAWKVLKSQADALVAVSTNDTEENATLASAISAQNTNVEAATTAEAISSATTTLKGTMVTYVTTAQPINDECFDLTFMIVNPHFTEGDAVNPTGWTATYPEAPQGQWGGARELRLSTHNFEAYHKQFTLSQTIANLKKGTYKVTLQGFARHDDVNVTDKTNLFCGPVSQPIKEISEEYSTTSLISGKPAMGDNNGEAEKDGKYRPNGMSASYYYFQEINPATSQPFYTSEVQTLMKEDGNLTIGFKCETWSDWVIWDNFHLYYYGSAIAVTIDENAAGSVYDDDIENANITLKRTFSAGNWNTIALPFDLSDAETKAAFGSDAVVATCTETANGNNSDIAFNKAANAAITANTPVLLKTSTSESTFTFNGKTIKAGEAKQEGTNFDFVGTYAATTTIAEGDYFIGSNQLWKSAGATTIKGTRAYLKAKTAGARIANFLIDGDEATGIQTVNAKAQKSEKLYNMNGQEVKKAAKGLYIKNGKKMVVK
jgi:hypothetical protein